LIVAFDLAILARKGINDGNKSVVSSYIVTAELIGNATNQTMPDACAPRRKPFSHTVLIFDYPSPDSKTSGETR
jgi:hypothetical protein